MAKPEIGAAPVSPQARPQCTLLASNMPAEQRKVKLPQTGPAAPIQRHGPRAPATKHGQLVPTRDHANTAHAPAGAACHRRGAGAARAPGGKPCRGFLCKRY